MLRGTQHSGTRPPGGRLNGRTRDAAGPSPTRMAVAGWACAEHVETSHRLPDVPAGGGCQDMEEASRTTVIVVRGGTNSSRSSEIRRWLRVLLPTALLVMSPAVAPFGEAYDVIIVDVDASDPGPLALADAIVRDRESRKNPELSVGHPESSSGA